MKKVSVVPLVFAAVCYLALFPLASACGLIHPACYAYVGTFLPLLFAPVYLLAAANCRSFGAAAALNGFTLIVGLLMGMSIMMKEDAEQEVIVDETQP